MQHAPRKPFAIRAAAAATAAAEVTPAASSASHTRSLDIKVPDNERYLFVPCKVALMYGYVGSESRCKRGWGSLRDGDNLPRLGLMPVLTQAASKEDAIGSLGYCHFQLYVLANCRRHCALIHYVCSA